jgi:hypothetical protein
MVGGAVDVAGAAGVGSDADCVAGREADTEADMEAET